jgi:hypothetical protein
MTQAAPIIVPSRVAPLEGPLPELTPAVLFRDGWMWKACFPDVLEGRPPHCRAAEKCPVCGDDGGETCPIVEDIGNRIICTIAALKKPDGGWPEGAVEQIIAAAYYAANY